MKILTLIGNKRTLLAGILFQSLRITLYKLNGIHYQFNLCWRLLGEEKLFSVYKVVAEMEGDEDMEMEAGWETIKKMVGKPMEGLVDRIIQLVVADTHYILAN